jgi:hypothetical protein
MIILRDPGQYSNFVDCQMNIKHERRSISHSLRTLDYLKGCNNLCGVNRTSFLVFQVFTAIRVQILVCWVVAQCSLLAAGRYQGLVGAR